jgi:hypothetical protein
VVLGAATAVFWTQEDPPPRARQYLDFKACLLTDAQGLAGTVAAPSWAGMQQASSKTRARVQYLSINGPATIGNAIPYLGTLAQLNCGVVVAAGELPASAIAANPNLFKSTKFIVVGAKQPVPNTQSVSGESAEITGKVAAMVTDLVKSS